MKKKCKIDPPGKIKIMKSLSQLMAKKDFHSITTFEIAKTAEVTEALIYKYFKDKKDLLYEVLYELFIEFNTVVGLQVIQKKTCIEKLEIIIAESLAAYTANRVFSKILFLEVRNSQGFFKTKAYECVRTYSKRILGIIEKGIDNGELKPSIDPIVFRKIILGAIEHACLGEIVFERELDIDTVSKGISSIVFEGAKAE